MTYFNYFIVVLVKIIPNFAKKLQKTKGLRMNEGLEAKKALEKLGNKADIEREIAVS